MARVKGITPIISIIVLLLIMVALAGAAWTYISGFTSAYTTKVIDLPPGSSYFDGKNIKIMLRNIGTSAINTGSCSVSGQNNNTVTCGDIIITREGSSNNADIRPSASSISPKGSVTITDYACESGNVKYIISSPTSTYQIDVNADIPCSFPTDPVSWWKFDGDAKDSAGSNDGTPVGGVSWTNDATRGQVASFDGVDDYVSTSSSTVLDPYPFTFSAWVKLNSYNPDLISGYAVILGNYIGGTDSIFYINAIGQLAIRPHPGTDLTGNTPISLNTWTHVVATLEGTNLKVYVNGKEDGSGSSAGYSGGESKPIIIGRASWFSGSYFNGLIDDVMIFKRALSPEEINAIYNSQKK